MKRFLFAALTLLLLPPIFSSAQEEPAQDDLAERAKKFREDVTRVRGLDFRSDVKVGVYTRQELTEFLRTEMDREFPREKANKFGKAYAHFGLIPKDLDLYDAVIELFTSAMAGFYHPKTKELRLIKPGEADAENAAQEKQFKDAFGVSLEDITLVHELCHAAQDQHFDLDTLPMEDETNDDLIAAIKGVIEGDASIVGFKYGLGDKFEMLMGMINQGYKSGQLPGKAGQLPAYLRLTLTFPYGHGSDFVLKQVKGNAGDTTKTSTLFRHFPTSTEQILHPAKYLGDSPDWPTLITFADLSKILGTSATPLCTNVHGEFGIQILLKELLQKQKGAAKTARQASEGWDGDRYTVYDEGDQTYSVWLSNWDTPEDAKEFFDAYLTALQAKYPDAKAEEGKERTRTLTIGDRVTFLEIRDTDVLVLDNVTGAMQKKVDEIFTGARKSELKDVVRSSKEGKEKPASSTPEKKDGKKEY